jgi:hypothetical protein
MGCGLKRVGAAILVISPVTGGFPGCKKWPFGFEINRVSMVTLFNSSGLAVRARHASLRL